MRSNIRTRSGGAKVRRGFLLLMLAGSALITAMSVPYFEFDTVPEFVIEKLPLRFEALWLGSLRVHVAAAALTFPLCLALVTRTLQRQRTWHRWIGRATGLLVLFALVPSGIVLAFDAKGGKVTTAGFLLSAAIVTAAMFAGIRAARRREFSAHARAMQHVVGQMSVAVVSRGLIVGLDAVGVNPDLAYVVALWGPVLASVAIIEVMGGRWSALARSLNRVALIERMRRELSSLSVVVRVRALVGPLSRFGR